MEIKIFGPGCAKCTQTYDLVKEVVTSKNDASIHVTKTSDLLEMMKYNIISTPAIVIDNVVKSTGKIPTKTEINEWIDKTVQASDPSAGKSPIAGSDCNCGCKCS